VISSIAPIETSALIIVDAWDRHWDPKTNKNADVLCSKINSFATKFRERGGLIIHAPSDVVDNYNQQEIELNFPYNTIKQEQLLKKLSQLKIPFGSKPLYGPLVWSFQNKNIEIKENDYISECGKVIYNILQQHNISTLYYCGMHSNHCILWTREFSILHMIHNNIKTLLIGELTLTLPLDGHVQIINFYNKHICPVISEKEIFERKSSNL